MFQLRNQLTLLFKSASESAIKFYIHFSALIALLTFQFCIDNLLHNFSQIMLQIFRFNKTLTPEISCRKILLQKPKSLT